MKEVDIRLHPYTVLLTGNGLKLFLMRCRGPKAFDVTKHFGIKIEHCLLTSKEQDALSQIMQVFRGEEMIHQFSTGKYKTDLYFPRYKLAIECDEFHHIDRDIGYEVEQQKHIEKLLNCTFVRFNPDAKDVCILGVVNKIFVKIKSFFKKNFRPKIFVDRLQNIMMKRNKFSWPNGIMKMLVELYVVTINQNPWTCAKEVCRALQYNKKTENIVKNYCSRENYAQKYQMSDVPTAVIYINEEGMYELLFSSQQPKAKDFRRHFVVSSCLTAA